MAKDKLSRAAVIRGQWGDDEIIRIILAEIQELRRQLQEKVGHGKG